MKITKHIGEHKLPFMLYESMNKTTNILVFIHGLGETGPSDGTQLSEVEYHGPPRHAAGGYEYPFDVVAPQLAVWKYEDVVDLINVLSFRYGYKKVFITGLSAGGELSWKSLQGKFRDIELVGIAPISAKWYDGLNLACSLADVPIDPWHNYNDPVMPYDRGGRGEKYLIQAINNCPGRVNKIKFDHIYPGDSHDAWTNAYRIGSTLEDFINKSFGEYVPTPNEPITQMEFSPDAGQIIFKTLGGRTLTLNTNG